MKTVWVGMSGGVDSSVAALLLQEQGYRVVGVTLRLRSLLKDGNADAMEQDVLDARRVCEVLGIEHRVLDYSETFSDTVVFNFVDEYLHGRTPNPCVLCNQVIKFGRMLDDALKDGADYLATGHYARCFFSEKTGRWSLERNESSKDQTYMLYGLSQSQLSHILFPLSDFHKEQVRQIAADHHLPIAHKADSMEACFVPPTGHTAFIEAMTGKPSCAGDFVTEDGTVLGRHGGICRYTIGQRKGLGVTFGKPMFVVGIDAEHNRVVLGEEGRQLSDMLTAGQVNYVSIDEPNEPIRVQAKIRYQAPPAPAMLYPLEGGQAKLVFDEKQRSVTPGQSVVFYRDRLVLGGGIIE